MAPGCWPMGVLLMTDILKVFTQALSSPFIQPEKHNMMIFHLLASCQNFFLLSITICSEVILRFFPSCSGNLEVEAPPTFPGYWPATSWGHYTTCCNTQSSAPEDGQNNCPKHVELIGIIKKPLLLHVVGCLYYLYQ